MRNLSKFDSRTGLLRFARNDREFQMTDRGKTCHFNKVLPLHSVKIADFCGIMADRKVIL
jgi:hypothetical protein